MSKTEKLLARLRRRPKDFSWDEAISILKHLGFEQESGGGGSHRTFVGPDRRIFKIAQPHPQNILKMYQVDALLELIDDIGVTDEDPDT